MSEHRGPDGATRRNMFQVDPNSVVLVGTDPGTEKELTHPCFQQHNGRPITDEFVDTFITMGCIEPVSVWLDDKSRWCVAAGRRRTLALRAANAKGHALRLPCLQVKGDVEGLKLVENAHRAGVHVMDSARDAARYQSAGHTVEETAKRLNVSGETIRNWRKLLSLAPAVQRAIETDAITATDALKRCVGKTAAQQLAALEKPKTRMGRPSAPARATLRKLVESRPAQLSADFVRGVQYALGDLTDKDVGL